MSARSSTRRIVLIVVLVLLGVAVFIDRVGLAGQADSDGVESRFALASAQLERQRELLDSADAVQDEIAELRDAWEAMRGGLVSARTVELAPAALRDRVRRVLTDAGVGDLLVLSEEIRTGANPQQPADLVPMRIRVSFDIDDSPALYRAIDQVEQSTILLARIGELSVRGGGLNEVAQRVTVTLSIDTVVLIEGASP